MTRMLVKVTDAAEAAMAAAACVDAVELAMTGRPATDTAAATAVRAAFPGTLRLTFDAPRLTSELVSTAASVRADEVALALDPGPPSESVPDLNMPSDLTVVAVLGASSDFLGAVHRVRGRAGATMLDAGAAGRLVDQAAIGQLDAFATSCRESRLPYGLAGGLEAPDVSRLLLLEPDVLGFDSAVRRAHRTEAPLDRRALEAIRALIPRTSGAAPAVDRAHLEVTDRIFVRDFVVPLAIGAYQAEHGVRQRVRFSVEADVRRAPQAPRDMRDVFSYDVAIETIRVLAQRAHVTFVETLAEEVAASLLTHADVVGVTIKVEKLDVIDGAVGIEISRRTAR